jgi:hypothetical protein
MDHQELIGKTLALLIFAEREGQEDDVHVIDGTVQEKEGVLVLQFSEEHSPFPIQEDWLPRIKPTPEGIQAMLQDVQFFLSLSMGPLPENANMAEYLVTGLNLSS